MKNTKRHILPILALALLAGCNVGDAPDSENPPGDGPSNDESSGGEYAAWVADTLNGYTFMIPPDVAMRSEFTGIDTWHASYSGDSVGFSVMAGMTSGPDLSPERPEYAERFLPVQFGSALLITADHDTVTSTGYFAGLYLYNVDSAQIERGTMPVLVFIYSGTAAQRDLAVRIFEGVVPLE